MTAAVRATNCPAWCTAGSDHETDLGAPRHHRIIAQDYDTDIAVETIAWTFERTERPCAYLSVPACDLHADDLERLGRLLHFAAAQMRQIEAEAR